MEAILTIEKIFSYNDLHFLPEGNYEIIDGERVDMTPTAFRHGKIEFKIAKLLENKLWDKGYVAVGEIGIVIKKEPFRLRAADVVYISKDTSPEEPDGILEIAPDLIIEIISKDDTIYGMNDKIKDYQSIGVKRIVVVDPFTEMITIYQHKKKDIAAYTFDEDFDLFQNIKIRMREIL